MEILLAHSSVASELLFSHETKIIHCLLLHYFFTTIINVPGSYPVTNIVKTLLKFLKFLTKSIMS